VRPGDDAVVRKLMIRDISHSTDGFAIICPLSSVTFTYWVPGILTLLVLLDERVAHAMKFQRQPYGMKVGVDKQECQSIRAGDSQGAQLTAAISL
jgi:hypothetical protein